MLEVPRGSKTDLTDLRYTVTVNAGIVDTAAVLLASNGKVRGDDDFVFYNNPARQGVALISDASISVDLSVIPADIDRVLITGSTEAQAATFGTVGGLTATVVGERQSLTFRPDRLTTETVLQLVAFYRRNGRWRLDAIGQGYSAGLAAFATDHGIDVDDPGHQPAPAVATRPQTISAPPVGQNPINFHKVKVAITKDSPSQATIDLRKSGGDPSWVLTVGLEWDGRGAVYAANGAVKRYGDGDLDVYFYCRNEHTNDYVVISGENGHRGSLDQWPFIYHFGDSLGPGHMNCPAVEQVQVRPVENGDLLVNVYQSVDNGTGALNTFGRPRVAVRYGRPGPNGLLGTDADEIMVYVGNSRNCYWATVAHIDVQDGILTVDGKTRYSAAHSESMPGLTTRGKWVREPVGGPIGRSKAANQGIGLTQYAGQCPTRTR
ncbi:TerD family protein [Nocardia salmonicida]|uniref:TerD family protein n=1 Tax=Nocardia salmonicida TaxID=53431 RepID=UPI0033F81B1F